MLSQILELFFNNLPLLTTTAALGGCIYCALLSGYLAKELSVEAIINMGFACAAFPTGTAIIVATFNPQYIVHLSDIATHLVIFGFAVLILAMKTASSLSSRVKANSSSA